MSQQPRKMIHLPKVRMLSRVTRSNPGLRVTNVKSIKPPDPELQKQQEEDKLRAQLQKEIVSRSRSCSNSTYECGLPVLAGHQYCRMHILQEPNAPYRQCVHVSGGGDRCPLPAPTESRDHRCQGLCFEHARQTLMSRQRAAAPPPPVVSTETLLNQLEHYIRPERTRTTSCASTVSVVSDHNEQDQTPIPHAVDPMKQIDATSVNTAYSASIMECASASDSDSDGIVMSECRDVPDDCSEEDDPPSIMQCKWKAGVFTAEEAVCEARNTLKSLQSAYIRQMGRLRVLLQMARAKYLKQVKAEKEQYCSINAQARGGPLTVKERRQLRKLKALAGYHRKHGVDAVLARKLFHKRLKVNDVGNQRGPPPHGRCTFTEGGVRCSSHVVPATKHCRAHILQDRHQVLYHPCGDMRGGVPCREPVPRLPLPSARCRYHTNPPLYTVFTLKKENSDSETESHSSSDESHVEDGNPSEEAFQTFG